jgi:hypothetical protein
MAAQAANEEDIGACTLDQRKLTINKKWRITEKIASGGFGAIYKAQDKDSGDFVVVKTERRVGKNYLDREAEVFKKMAGQEGFPGMIWRGKIYYKENKKRKGCSSIIMDVLGPSLSDLFYQQGKRESEARKHQRHIQVKEVKFRPKIDEHDFQFKKRNVERFLNDGNKVKSTVIFRGREMAHNEIGRRILNRLASELLEVALIEVPPRQEGMTMVQILSPKKEPPKPVRASKKADGGDGKAKAEKPEKAEKAPKVKKPETAAGGRPEKQTS